MIPVYTQSTSFLIVGDSWESERAVLQMVNDGKIRFEDFKMREEK